MKRRHVFFLAMVMFIYIFSSMPGAVSKPQSDAVARVILAIGSKRDVSYSIVSFVGLYARKIVHMIEFAALAIAGIIAVTPDRDDYAFRIRHDNWSVRYFLVFLFCIVYAASDEFHQLFVDGRGACVEDVLIDTTGSAIGMLLYQLVHTLLRRTKKSPG